MTTIDLTKIAKQLAELAAEDSSANKLDDERKMLVESVGPLRTSTREKLQEARIEIDQLLRSA